MSNHTYLPVLQSIVYGNEEDRKHQFEGFTDVEMTYYFVLRRLREESGCVVLE
ncbi:hypothetical protein [Bacillus sp. OTU530]|uniref:hypothetical protein n=1 Tax=Bacillus sp. OTU530 TaxID=3043862 RepID=UPI00313C2BE4